MMSKRGLGFSCMGSVCILWMLFSLWRGEIWGRSRVVITRASNPIGFYTWIGYYAVLAILFLGAGIFFLLNPHFSLIPTSQASDD